MIWRLIGTVKMFLDKCKRDNINAFAAQSAFFIIVSAIPFLMLFSSLLQYTPVTEGVLMNIINHTLPTYVAPFFVSIVDEVYNKSIGIVSVAAVVAIWSAAKGFQYIANGLNVINGLEETRNWFVLRFWAIIYTIVFVIAVVITLVLLVFGKSLKMVILQYVPILAGVTEIVLRLRSLIMLGILILFFAVLFQMIPNRKASFRLQLPGAVLCAVAWYVFSFGLSIYVGYFNGFSMYGSLTTIVLIMLWLYFCMYIMMICAEVNVMFEESFEKWMLRRRQKSKKRVDV